MAPPTLQGAPAPVVPIGAGRAGTTPPALGADSRKHLRVVRSVRERRRRAGVLTTVIVTLVFAALFALAAMQAVLVQGQLRLDALNRDVETRLATVDRLELEVSTLEAPDRLAEEARRLGMVEPPEIAFLEASRSAPPTSAAPTGAAPTPPEADPGEAAGPEGPAVPT
ncbi:MAG: hypothetical protein OEY23_21105 [Acidimicrobiia bacterium]|nr:hypothetical protein [Acidimicrobiia bacterium]